LTTILFIAIAIGILGISSPSKATHIALMIKHATAEILSEPLSNEESGGNSKGEEYDALFSALANETELFSSQVDNRTTYSDYYAFSVLRNKDTTSVISWGVLWVVFEI